MHFDPISDFCDVQWDILALLQILDGPVPMDMLAVLVPVEPGPFYDLINCAIEQGWRSLSTPQSEPPHGAVEKISRAISRGSNTGTASGDYRKNWARAN